VTKKRNGPLDERPAPRTVENVRDDLDSYITTSKSGLKRITAADLAKVEFPPLQWAVPELLPQGTAVIAGAPKIGKSAFALNLCVAVATGAKAFGKFNVQQGDALYFPLEDGGYRRVQERLFMQLNGEPAPQRLHLFTDLSRLDDGGAFELESELTDLPETRLVIIDTLQRVRPGSNRNRQLYENDYESVAMLTDMAARRNLTIALIHHTREMKADDWLDSVSGSRGLSAAVDTIIVANRGRGSVDAVLRTTGKDFAESEHAFSVDFETMTWTSLGDATIAQLPVDRRDVIAAVAVSGPMTPTQIANATGLKANNLYGLVGRMVDDGLLKNHGDGTYGPAYLKGLSNE
jgi:hypothetical protein